MSDQAREQIIDEEHLRLLALGFIAMMAANPDMFPTAHGRPAAPPQDVVMRIFAVVIGMLILAGWSFGGLTIYVGRCLKRRTRRTLTFVVACLNTLLIPFGTVLGVFTLIVLSRPSVKRLYRL